MNSPDPLGDEIRERLGVLPNFFRLAPEAPEIASNLWAFARFGYLDNPLPALFKERLFVSLSRFCEVRYCIARHVGFLIGLGRASGDARVTPATVEQTVELLRRPLSRGDELTAALARMAARGEPSGEVPEPDSPDEKAVFDCATHVFSQTSDAPRCREALSHFFAPETFQHLLVFLAFVRTAHFWTVVHPELDIEDDVSEMLAVYDALAECVIAQQKPVDETLGELIEERESLRKERHLRKELERANAELREERERLQVTLASIGDGVITTDTEGRIRDMNAVAEELTGRTRSESIGLPLDRVFHIIDEAQRRPVESPVERALRADGVQWLANDTLLVAKDGTERPIDDSAAPIRGTDGRVLGCVLIFRDVTERQEKHESSERLAAIVESSDDAIISKSLDGVIRTWNRGAERLFGYPADEAVGRHITMLIPPDRVGEEDMIISRISAGEHVDHFDTVRRRRDGAPVEVSVSISPIKDMHGTVIGASKVARDITDRRRAEEALRHAARVAAEADERKDRFLAILAHELRNPLAPIRSCVEVLNAEPADGSAEALAIMDRQVTQMVRLIDDLMDVSRISRGKLRLRKAPTDVHAVLRAAIESVAPRAADEGVTITADAAEEIALDADAARLTQVFANLLTNAIKHSERGDTIVVRVLPGADDVRICVIDEGAGIPHDEIERIFDMFRQVEGEGREESGLGIGLTMARELVEMHGGRLTASSEGRGRGATFTVTLPVARHDAPSDAAPTRVRPRAVDRLKVLVVDDLHDSADALSMLLSLRGCDVRTEFTGRGALRTAEDFCPDVVFLDIGMPEMDGLETAAHLRRTPWGRDLLLVALSGWGQDADRAKTASAGFDEHILKPADLAAIDRILERAVAD